MKFPDPLTRERIQKVISRPITGTLIISAILVLVGLIPWYWINGYLERNSRNANRDAYYRQIAENAVRTEKVLLAQFKSLDPLYGNITQGRYLESADRSTDFTRDVTDILRENPMGVEISWIDPESGTVNYPETEFTGVTLKPDDFTADNQLRQDPSDRWWIIRQKLLPGSDLSKRLVMAVPVDALLTADAIEKLPEFIVTALVDENGTTLAGTPIPQKTEPILIPIYLDGVELGYVAGPLDGWGQSSLLKNLPSRLLGLATIFGVAALVYLVLKRQEKLNLSILKRTLRAGAGIQTALIGGRRSG